MPAVKKPLRSLRRGLLFSSREQNRPRPPAAANKPTTPRSTKSPRKTTVKTQILILSDTHGHASLPSPLPQYSHLDAVIHCGDLSQCGETEAYKRTMELLKAIPASLKLVIPGNHDLSLDPSFPTHPAHDFSKTERENMFHQARDLWTGREAKEARIILLDPGFHELDLENGGRLKLYATPLTPLPPGVSSSEWAFGYPSSHDIYNPAGRGIWYSTTSGNPQTMIPNEKMVDIDVLMSHGPPKYRLDKTEDGENVGCKHLWRAVRRSRPRLHVFGHVHAGFGGEKVKWIEDEDREGALPRDDDVDDGIEELGKIDEKIGEGGVRLIEIGKGKKETIFVNAALMVEQELERMPWVVEMMLEKADLTEKREIDGIEKVVLEGEEVRE
jgi:Calcineurin-like phosphoesterase